MPADSTGNIPKNGPDRVNYPENTDPTKESAIQRTTPTYYIPHPTNTLPAYQPLYSRQASLIASPLVFPQPIIQLQQPFQQHIQGHDQAYSGLLYLHTGQPGLQHVLQTGGVCYQPPAQAPLLWVNPQGSNLPGHLYNQLQDQHNRLIQNATTHIQALCAQLAYHQYELQNLTHALITQSQQLQLHATHYPYLLPPSAAEPVSLDRLQHTVGQQPFNPHCQPCLPAGCTMPPFGGWLHNFPPYQNHWVPGRHAFAEIPFNTGFHFVPQPPSSEYQYHSPINPQFHWHNYLNDSQQQQNTFDPFPGLSYPEGNATSAAEASPPKPAPSGTEQKAGSSALYHNPQKEAQNNKRPQASPSEVYSKRKSIPEVLQPSHPISQQKQRPYPEVRQALTISQHSTTKRRALGDNISTDGATLNSPPANKRKRPQPTAPIGKAEGFVNDYRDTAADIQANKIIDQLKALALYYRQQGQPDKLIGITYSANLEQANDLLAEIGKGTFPKEGVIDGAKQAETMKALIKKMHHPDNASLKDKVRIFGIPTISYDKGSMRHLVFAEMEPSINAAEAFVQRDNGHLLVLQDPETKAPAIGGGVAGMPSDHVIKARQALQKLMEGEAVTASPPSKAKPKAPDPLPGSQQFAEIRVGFPNKNNTCYINSAIKAVIAGIPHKVFDSLKEKKYTGENNEIKQNIKTAFLTLIEAVRENKIIDSELDTLFAACARYREIFIDGEMFHPNGKPTGQQNDPDVFIKGLFRALEINDHSTHHLERASWTLFPLSFDDDDYEFPVLRKKEPEPFLIINQDIKTTQSINELVNQAFSQSDIESDLTREEAQNARMPEDLIAIKFNNHNTVRLKATQENVLSGDIEQLKVLKVRVNPAQDGSNYFPRGAKALFPDKDGVITMKVLDKEQVHNVKFRPKTLCLHTGNTPDGGHHTAAVREGEQWYLHNDSIIEPIGNDIRMIPENRIPCIIFYERVD